MSNLTYLKTEAGSLDPNLFKVEFIDRAKYCGQAQVQECGRRWGLTYTDFEDPLELNCLQACVQTCACETTVAEQFLGYIREQCAGGEAAGAPPDCQDRCSIER
jgi:hypothetical protein